MGLIRRLREHRDPRNYEGTIPTPVIIQNSNKIILAPTKKISGISMVEVSFLVFDLSMSISSCVNGIASKAVVTSSALPQCLQTIASSLTSSAQ